MSLTNFYRPAKRIALDADVSFTRARFVGVTSGASGTIVCSLSPVGPNGINEDPICMRHPTALPAARAQDA